MSRRNNAEYWAQRMKLMEDRLLNRAYDYVENLEAQFAQAQQEIEKDIARWFQRFADNNEISLADAKKLLNSDELQEFQWTLAEYIAYGQQNALDGSWMKELENASARVHISRLESLKLQIRQQAEVLHAKELQAAETALAEIYEESYYHTAYELQKGVGVGAVMPALNETLVEKVLSRPWTADNRTFRDRCWTDKDSLIRTVNTQLTQMIIRGEAPDRAISAISNQFGVSRKKAGRLVMTESAAFASAAQKDCYKALDVERYRIVATLDGSTCDLCGEMDSMVFKLSEYQVGLTAPPFHPWCRCCTCPHFEDMAGIGERWARDPVTGKSYTVPGDMTYKEWRELMVEEYDAEIVDLHKKMEYNRARDTEQFERYKNVLKENAPKSFKEFQRIKYAEAEGYAALKIRYADKRIQRWIQSEPLLTKLKPGAQGKHILGHNNYKPGRSYLTVSMDEAQELIKQYAGTGTIKRDGGGKWTHKEFVTTDRVIGYIVPLNGGEPIATKRFSISYAIGKDKGAHIVPAKEEKLWK